MSDTPSGFGLVDDLEAELEDPRLEGAGDLTSSVGNAAYDGAGGGGGSGAESVAWGEGALGSADGAGEVEVSVVEDVVELGAELHLEALDGRREVLVESEVGLVEGGS